MSAAHEPLEVLGYVTEVQRTSPAGAPHRYSVSINIEVGGDDLQRLNYSACPEGPKVALPPVPKSPGERLQELHAAHIMREGQINLRWYDLPAARQAAWERTAEAVGHK